MQHLAALSPQLPPLCRSEAFAEDLFDGLDAPAAAACAPGSARLSDVLLCLVPLGSALVGALSAATSWGA